MSKRVRITAIVTTLCLCLSLFVIGVLSATTATLNVTSTLKFEADGVYVMVDASLKQGASVTDADVIEGEGEPTGKTTYTAYSYKKATDSNAPDGSASSSTFLQADGTTPAGDWAIGDITYTYTNKVVVYEFTVSNYSPFEVTATITTNLSDIISASNGQLSAATYKDNIQDSSPTYSFNIPAPTNETTPGTITYQIAVTLESFMTGFTTNQIEMNLSFIKKGNEIEPVYEYFTYSSDYTKITGLSDVYKNLETKPETLVIPSKAPNGTPITEIGEETNRANVSDTSFDVPTLYAPFPAPGTEAIMKGIESKNIIIQNGITTIGGTSFFSCSLNTIFIPNSVKNIEEYAFYNSSLTKITFEEGASLISVGLCAFQGCDFIKNITLPSSVISIDSYAFNGCTSLESVTFEEGSKLTSIKTHAFADCSSLTSITIPSSVTSIGSDAFRNCTSLKYIQITGNLNSAYTLPSGTWVKTGSADKPTDWNTNVVDSIPASDSIGFYHQKSAWDKAS